MFQVFQLFKMYVSIVSYDVTKLDQDIAYVAMVVHICCKRLSLISHLFFLYTYVASVSNTCLKCFICLFLYVASVVSGCFKSRSVVASPSSLSAASPRSLVLLLQAPAGH